jgi:hypothetical protein
MQTVAGDFAQRLIAQGRPGQRQRRGSRHPHGCNAMTGGGVSDGDMPIFRWSSRGDVPRRGPRLRHPARRERPPPGHRFSEQYPEIRIFLRLGQARLRAVMPDGDGGSREVVDYELRPLLDRLERLT